MKKYSLHDLEKVFQSLPLAPEDCLFIHSSILNFGFPLDFKVSALPHILYKTLIGQIGKEGTLVVPTFNFGFCEGQPFDPEKTPSQNMGVFAEYIRKLPEAKRSPHPMQSVAAVGKQASYLTENDTPAAFDPESAFDRLIQLNAKILLLGSDFSYNSVFHWVEQKHRVPYRFWKSFTGRYTHGNQASEKTYRMYVRDLKEDLQLDFSPIEKELKKENKIVSTLLGAGEIQLYSLTDFITIAENHIRINPYYFIQK